MDFQMRYHVTPRYLTKPSKRRSGLPISPAVRFLVAHDTGNPRSTASNNVAYYERSRDERSASAHIFVDDREILECIPALTGEPEKAWHVRYSVPTDDQLFGADANDVALGIEYCYGTNIDADSAYDKYVWVLAYSAFKFDLDPKRCVVGHFFLDPHRRTDPVTGLAHSRRTYEQLQQDVVQEYWVCLGKEAPEHDPASTIPSSGTVKTTVRLNIRRGAPNTRAPVHQTLGVGTELAYSKAVNGEAVNANPLWLGTDDGNFFWSGGVEWTEGA